MKYLTQEMIEIAKKYDMNYWQGKNEIIFEKADKTELIDVNGNRLIDFSEITGNIGQGNETFKEKVLAAIDEITVEKGFINKYKAELFEKLAVVTDNSFDKIFFASSGSEITEWAIRIARRHKDSSEILSFWGGLHGRTYAAASMTGLSKRKIKLGAKMPGCVYAPYPYCYRCPFDKKVESCNNYCIDFIDMIIDAETTRDLAAVIVEPYQGVGGMIFPPQGYLKKLEEWAKSRELIFILDEIQSGFGRTGDMFAYQYEDLNPDMICIGKGLGNGFHIAGLLTSSEIASSIHPSELSGGSGGNPLSCAAGAATIDVICNEKLLENAKENGKYIEYRLSKMKEKINCIGDYRGRGMAFGIEFVEDRKTKKRLNIVPEIVKRAYDKGLFLTGGGNILSLRPPISITKNQVERAMNIIEEILTSI